MPSPIRAKSDGTPHGVIMGWLVAYEAATPGVEALDNTTLRLNTDNEPQPDAIEVFPGLWLDISALLAGDLARVIDLLQQEVSTQSHQDFV